MSLSRNTINQFKKFIQENHEMKTYNENELVQIIETIIEQLTNQGIINEDTKTIAKIFTVYHLYYSDSLNKFQFNTKRRSKHRDYHQKLLEQMNLVVNDPNKIVDFEENEIVVKETDAIINIDQNPILTIASNPNMITKIISNEPEKTNITDPVKPINNESEMKAIEITEEQPMYTYPDNKPFKYTKRTSDKFEPFGTQWYHDEQVDDMLNDTCLALEKQFDIVRAIKVPDQRTPEWYEMRDGKITASDGGTVLDQNHHDYQYKFILKKVTDQPFLSNKFVHHGKKYEDIATKIYEYRMNVLTEEFGLIGHPKYSFLGASPDRICGKYKLDGIHRSKYVGRMLEIKCPLVRKINMDGDIIDHICPIYYWIQVQLQLECCDLEECDFWQCEIREYDSRDEFINDTDPNEPFRSKETQFEKGCVIQLLPKNKMEDIINGKHDDVVYDSAMYIYPPHVEMSPYDCDIWIAEKLGEINTNPKYKDYFFDQVVYWKLVISKCVTINRDRVWFAENLPKFKQMWDYVLILRKNKDKVKILVDYIDSLTIKKNKPIMEVVRKLCDVTNPNYNNIIKEIEKSIQTNKTNKDIKASNKVYEEPEYMFVDTNTGSDYKFVNKKNTTTNTTNKPVKKTYSKKIDNSDYMFV